MEKHTCKLCFRRFSNGRALGGHMRSHVSAAAATTKEAPPAPHPAALMLLEDHHQQEPSLYSPSSSSSSGPEEAVALALEKGGPSSGGGGVSYVLRENPRKSYRVVDPEFSSVADYTFFFGASGGNGNSSSVVVQDRESETESSRAPSSSRRRSKRRRRYSPVPPLLPPKSEDNSSKHPTVAEAEPVSSVSDTTPDDDVALCLMMLSRDVWTWKDQHRNRGKQEEKKREEEEEEEEERIYVAEKEEEDHHQSESEEEEEERRMTTGAGSRSRKGGRSRYQCGTCRKVFRSYQALGGHRASHKKAKPCAVVAPLPPLAPASGNDNDSHHQQHQIHDGEFEANGGDPRVHECPFCFRVFSSGQALGGHKRSHFVSAAPSPRRPNAVTTAIATNTFAAAVSSYSPATAAAGNDSGAAKLGKSFIDLNLPAPVEFEDGSHVELSDVSDGKE